MTSEKRQTSLKFILPWDCGICSFLTRDQIRALCIEPLDHQESSDTDFILLSLGSPAQRSKQLAFIIDIEF